MTDKELKKLQETELSILKDFHDYCSCHGLKYYLIGGALLGVARYNGFIPWDDDIDVGMPREDYERLKELWEKENLPNYFLQHEKSEPLFSRAIMKLRKNNTCIVEKTTANIPIHNGIYIDIFPIDYLERCSDLRIAARAKMIRGMMTLRTIKCGYQNGRYIQIKRLIARILDPIHLTWFDDKIKKLCTKDNNRERRLAILYTHNYCWKKQIHATEVFGQGKVRNFEGGGRYICPDKTELFLEKVFGENYLEEPPLDKRKNPHNYISLSFSESGDYTKDQLG